MYEIDLIKNTKLAKQLGGPPIFIDGYLHRANINHHDLTLDIKILSQNNPLLNRDTLVQLKMIGIKRLHFDFLNIKNQLMIIHDLEIRKEGTGLHMILESNTGEISEVWFESIELHHLN